MRQYDMVFGILLIFSIIDFALAAPVPIQAKRHTGVDMVHIPRDMITVSEKRGADGELEKLAEYFDTLETTHASSSSAPQEPIHASSSSAPQEPTHASSSSAPQEPEHGPVNDVQTESTSNPVSSTPNPNPLVEPSSPLSTVSSTYTSPTDYGSISDSLPEWNDWTNPVDWHQLDGMQPPTPPLSSQEHGVANGHQVDNVQQPNGQLPHENGVANGYQVDNVQQPNGQPPHENGVANGHQLDPSSPVSASSTSTGYGYYDLTWAHGSGLDSVPEWDHSTNPGDRYQLGGVQPLDPSVEPSSPVSAASSTHTSTSSGYGQDELTWAEDPVPQLDHWTNPQDWHQLDNMQPLTPALSPQENSVADWHQVDNVQQPNPGLSNPRPTLRPSIGPSSGLWDYWRSLENQPVPRPVSPTENDLAHGYQVDDVQQASPPPQVNGVAHGTQMDDAQQPDPLLPQENGVAHGTQMNDAQQPNPPQENV